MIKRTWIGAAMLIVVALPASAQMTPGSPQTTPPQPGTMQQTPPMQPDPMQQPPGSTPPPATQTNPMPSDSMPPMSASDQRKMQACQAMPQEAMMKDKRCDKLMKMHPEMGPNTPSAG